MSTFFQREWVPERGIEFEVSYEMEKCMNDFSTYWICWNALRGTEFDLGEEKEWMLIPDHQPTMVRAIADTEWVKLLKEKELQYKSQRIEPDQLTRHTFWQPGYWTVKRTTQRNQF